MGTVIAIDPGREKCGLAVVNDEGALLRKILPPHEIAALVADLLARYSTDTVVIGDGTHGSTLAEMVRDASPARIEFVDESHTTLEARARYYEENPPRGLLRLIPRGMLAPSEPVDDLVAVILGERYLAAKDAEASRT